VLDRIGVVAFARRTLVVFPTSSAFALLGRRRFWLFLIRAELDPARVEP
jgi:hypothetical protein